VKLYRLLFVDWLYTSSHASTFGWLLCSGVMENVGLENDRANRIWVVKRTGPGEKSSRPDGFYPVLSSSSKYRYCSMYRPVGRSPALYTVPCSPVRPLLSTWNIFCTLCPPAYIRGMLVVGCITCTRWCLLAGLTQWQRCVFTASAAAAAATECRCRGRRPAMLFILFVVVGWVQESAR